jgi:ABC-type glycerol-3-phosphate transport system substrate-binding protein
MLSRRHVQRRAALALLGSTVTAAALTACDSSAAGGSKTRQPAKVVFWNYGGGGVSDQLFAATVDGYKKAAPETTVERVGIPSAEIQDKLVVSWTSDVVPDIVMDSNRGFLRFMDSGWFLDLSKEFATRKLKPSDFYEVPLKTYQIDGKQMGMPQGWGTSLYAINTDLTDKAGIKLNPGVDDNWTADDFVRLIKPAIKYDGQGRQEPPGGVDDSVFFHWLYSYGGDFLNADKTKAVANTPEALAAAEAYAKVHTSDRVYLRDGIDKRAEINFLQGTLLVHGNGIANSIVDYSKAPGKIQIFNKPRGTKGRFNRLYLDGYILGKNTKAKDATVDFLFWLLDDGARIIEQMGGNNIPSTKKVTEQVWLTSMTQFNKKKWLDAAATARPDPLHPKWNPDLSAVYGKYSGQLRAGTAGAREAMINMTNDAQAILDEYRRQRGR